MRKRADVHPSVRDRRGGVRDLAQGALCDAARAVEHHDEPKRLPVVEIRDVELRRGCSRSTVA